MVPERCRTDRNRILRPPNKQSEAGFSLPLLICCAVVLFGMLGLAFDMGRMFITKNELQTFADASAMAALSSMNGTQQGIQAANATATAGPLGTVKPNGYNFDTTAITDVTATYATSFGGTYDSYATASSPATNNYAFIKVTANANLPMNFLPVIPGVPNSITLSASAIAGQKGSSSTNSLAPFMPDGHDMTDTIHFGFVVGQEYTLKWGNGSTTCGGDLNSNPPFVDPDPSSQHGFVNLGQGNSNSALRDAIVYGADPNSPVQLDTLLQGVPGNRGSSIFSALSALAAQDTDDTDTYPDYLTALANGTANGRRIITVAIGNPSTWNGNGNGTEQVAGFGNFLLDTTYSGTSGAICATYLGPANINGVSSGSTDGTKIYSSALFQ